MRESREPPSKDLYPADGNAWRLTKPKSNSAVKGPDTDTLTAPYRQNEGKGTHFNDAGLKAHGLLWADKVSQYLDTILR
jgi:hypothetical protein